MTHCIYSYIISRLATASDHVFLSFIRLHSLFALTVLWHRSQQLFMSFFSFEKSQNAYTFSIFLRQAKHRVLYFIFEKPRTLYFKFYFICQATVLDFFAFLVLFVNLLSLTWYYFMIQFLLNGPHCIFSYSRVRQQYNSQLHFLLKGHIISF